MLNLKACLRGPIDLNNFAFQLDFYLEKAFFATYPNTTITQTRTSMAAVMVVIKFRFNMLPAKIWNDCEYWTGVVVGVETSGS